MANTVGCYAWVNSMSSCDSFSLHQYLLKIEPLQDNHLKIEPFQDNHLKINHFKVSCYQSAAGEIQPFGKINWSSRFSHCFLEERHIRDRWRLSANIWIAYLKFSSALQKLVILVKNWTLHPAGKEYTLRVVPMCVLCLYVSVVSSQLVFKCFWSVLLLRVCVLCVGVVLCSCLQ